MKNKVCYLVVDSKGDVRIRQQPRLAWNEVAYKLTVQVPDSWSKVVGSFSVTLPEPPLPDVLPEGWERV